MTQSLGDRIKGYEKVSSHTLLPKVPVIIRVDGRAFHTFTKNCDKPFDEDFMTAMVWAAEETVNEMSGFKCAYVQSDEVTFLLTDYDAIQTRGWFGYKVSKLVSISSALMSVNFVRFYFNDRLLPKSLPVFTSV